MSKMSDIQVQIQEVETVSKQTVIDAFKVWLIDNNDMRRFEEVVRDLQPVEQIQAREDAVSRQDAIMHINFALDAEDAVKRVEKMPPVIPTRVKAHWIKSESKEGHYKCSKCLCEHNDPETGKWHEIFDFKYPSCPICGADMREGES